jgi:hypothetical protein
VLTETIIIRGLKDDLENELNEVIARINVEYPQLVKRASEADILNKVSLKY